MLSDWRFADLTCLGLHIKTVFSGTLLCMNRLVHGMNLTKSSFGFFSLSLLWKFSWGDRLWDSLWGIKAWKNVKQSQCIMILKNISKSNLSIDSSPLCYFVDYELGKSAIRSHHGNDHDAVLGIYNKQAARDPDYFEAVINFQVNSQHNSGFKYFTSYHR